MMGRIERLMRIMHGLQRPCPYCGAAIGEPCVSRNGITQWTIGHTHDARLSSDSSRLKRSVSGQARGRMDR